MIDAEVYLPSQGKPDLSPSKELIANVLIAEEHWSGITSFARFAGNRSGERGDQKAFILDP